MDERCGTVDRSIYKCSPPIQPHSDPERCGICNAKIPTDVRNRWNKEWEHVYTHCPKCGGEKDSEGWCANYCMEGE